LGSETVVGEAHIVASPKSRLRTGVPVLVFAHMHPLLEIFQEYLTYMYSDHTQDCNARLWLLFNGFISVDIRESPG